jgi:ATP-dependent RNA helicase DeaD
VGAIHGDYTQARRDEIMKKFKSGMLEVLIATDVAARGLDIKEVTHVINYNIPQYPDSYIHRIGRTGRAGRSGMAITLITPREYKYLRLIEKSARTVIDRKRLPSPDDVIRAREQNIINDISEILKGDRHAGYIQIVKELSDTYASDDIASAALCAAYGAIKEKPVHAVYERDEPVRLFMNNERKAKIKKEPYKKYSSSRKARTYRKTRNNRFAKFQRSK